MEDEIKKGARNSRRDAQTLQVAHDALVDAGASCDHPDDKSIDPEEFVFVGSEVKALGDGKVAGYLVRYGDPKNVDLTGDFFSAGTDYGVSEGGNLPVYYQHGMDSQIKNKRIGRGVIKFDDLGLWFEAQLEMRDEYEKMIYELAEQGKLGWSSGAAGHLVEREAIGKAWHIKSWPIAESSLTPTPAEPRNMVVPLKSLSVETQVSQTQDEQDKPEAVEEPEQIDIVKPTGVKTMEINEEKLQELLTQASEDGAKKAIEATEGVKTAPGIVQVLDAEEDHPFKSIAENLQAVKEDFLTHGNSEKKFPRMRYLKATGASEGIPSDGGFLLDPTISSEIIKPMHEAGPFSQDVRRLPVGNNSNSGWINGVDETSRVTGSRWGGVRGYRLAEAATKTRSAPTFRRINWELKKYAVVVVGSDELLSDVAQFSAIVRQAVPEELNFMLNDDIMNGLGTGGPQGFMQSSALITVTRTTGSKILGEDISAMWNRMDLRGRATANWYIGNDSTPQLDNLFAVGSTAVLYPYASIGADGIQRLYGRPVYTTEFNASLNTTGDIALFDPKQYLLWEKGGIKEDTSIHVYFLSDETAFRFVMRVDGALSVNTPLTPYKGSTTTSPAVVLGSAT